METSLSGWKRSCYCAQVEEGLAGQEVTLMGWVQRRRNLGGLIFVWLRDRSGIVQLVFDSAQDAALQEQAETIRHEDVLAVKGVVVRRQEKDVNRDLATGAIAVSYTHLDVYKRQRHGRRPGFTDAELPEKAEPLYEAALQRLAGYGLRVQKGRFGADMQVELVNDGPVTLLLDSKKKF